MLKPTKHARTNFRMVSPYLSPLTETNPHRRIENARYMPLSLEYLYTKNDGRQVYSMTHYGNQNGDLMADPDMTFAVDFMAGTVEPLTWQNDYIGRYDQVYSSDGTRYSPYLRTSLDDFLWHWLQNIQAQGFRP